MLKQSKSLPSFVLLCALALPVVAQQTTFVRTNCFKDSPGKTREHQEFITNVTKKIAQARVDAGEIQTWQMLRAVIPAGSEATCDYIAAMSFAGFPPSWGSTVPALLEKANVAMSPETWAIRLNELRTLVKTEFWEALEQLNSSEKGDYVLINYMKVKPDAYEQWIENERKIWKPVMEERARRGLQKAWGVYALEIPGGTSLPYNAVSVDVYENWAAIGKPQAFDEVFKKVHPGKKSEELVAQTDKAREIVRSDLYEVFEKVTKQ